MITWGTTLTASLERGGRDFTYRFDDTVAWEPAVTLAVGDVVIASADIGCGGGVLDLHVTEVTGAEAVVIAEVIAHIYHEETNRHSRSALRAFYRALSGRRDREQN